MVQWAEQAISAVKEITITGRRSFFINQHSYHVHRFADALRSLTFHTTAPRLVIDTLSVAAMVLIATTLLSRGEDLQSTLLILGMFALAAVRLIPSASRLSGALAQLRYRYASTEVIYQELLALRQRPSDLLPGSAEEHARPIPFRRALCIEHLSYSYPGIPQPAIDDVSIEIPKGHWVGLIGSERRRQDHARRSYPRTVGSDCRQDPGGRTRSARQPCGLAAKYRIRAANRLPY